MFCRECGKEIRDQAVICPGCGCETRPSRSPAPVQFEKSEFLAVLLSFFIIGAGQCYTRQWTKGILLFFGGLLSLVLCLLIIGLIPLLALWVYSMYDAYHEARRINGQE